MKKLIVFIAISLLIVSQSVFAQDVIIQKNTVSSDVVKDEVFSINGISSREDIGGVDVLSELRTGDSYYFTFKNHNEVTVNVLYMINNQTGSIVLKAGEEKKMVYIGRDVKLIVRPLKGKTVLQNAQPQQLITVAGYLEYSDEFEDKPMWKDSALEILSKLNETNYMGHNDWRFPTKAECGLIGKEIIFKEPARLQAEEFGKFVPVRNK